MAWDPVSSVCGVLGSESTAPGQSSTFSLGRSVQGSEVPEFAQMWAWLLCSLRVHLVTFGVGFKGKHREISENTACFRSPIWVGRAPGGGAKPLPASEFQASRGDTAGFARADGRVVSCSLHFWRFRVCQHLRLHSCLSTRTNMINEFGSC